MNYNNFYNLSCYDEFEIQCTLAGISKIDALKEIGHEIDNYYFFVSDDGIFNWFDLEGNHIEDSGILRMLKAGYVSTSLTTCIIPNSIKYICNIAFHNCRNLKEITIPNNVTYIGDYVFSHCDSLKEVVFKWKTLKHVKQMLSYPIGIEDESIIKCEGDI